MADAAGVGFVCTLVAAALDPVVFVLSGVTVPALNVRELLLFVLDEVAVLLTFAKLAGSVGVKDGTGAAGGAEGAADAVLFEEVLVLEEDALFMIPGIFPPTEEFPRLAIVVGLGVLCVGFVEDPVLGVRFGIDLLLVFVRAEAVDLVDEDPVEDGLASSSSPCWPL